MFCFSPICLIFILSTSFLNCLMFSKTLLSSERPILTIYRLLLLLWLRFLLNTTSLSGLSSALWLSRSLSVESGGGSRISVSPRSLSVTPLDAILASEQSRTLYKYYPTAVPPNCSVPSNREYPLCPRL